MVSLSHLIYFYFYRYKGNLSSYHFISKLFELILHKIQVIKVWCKAGEKRITKGDFIDKGIQVLEDWEYK